MLIGGIALGLVLGLAAGGSIWNLGTVRLRRIAILFGAVVVRFSTEAAIGAGIEVAELLRLPLFGLAYAMLLAGLWWNRSHPGLSLAFIGILGNAIAIVLNGGFMPIWDPSLAAAGVDPNSIRSVFHTRLDAQIDVDFVLRAGVLGDIIPIPFPIVRNVASIGDIFLSLGLAFFLFATVLRSPQELDDEETEAVRRRLVGVTGARRPGTRGTAPTAEGLRSGTGLAPGLAEASALDRTNLLGAAGPGMGPTGGGLGGGTLAAPGATPALGQLPDVGATDRPVARPRIVARARRHPYVRLALNPNFSALWAGQLISLFGDRIHQIALAFLVLQVTDSILATALVFISGTLPNLVFSPIAGTFVDRWDHREVLVVSDILRAALILLVPIAAVVNIYLVYPLTFLITTISVFFRPARVAILPRVVREDELLPANSALWIGETMADIIGYPLAGLFVGFLGTALPLAFWVDAATYLASAALLWTLIVPPVPRAAEGEDEQPIGGRRRFFAEMGQGWGFLRRDRPLLANTLQATVAQLTLGTLIVLTPAFARDVITGATFDPKAVYAFLETGIGVGNLFGGLLIGLIGARFAKGRTIIVGYAAFGLVIALLGMTNQLPLAIGLMAGSGVANMIYVIPSQTMFQERTPPELIGRVVGFRFALVFGAMTLSMALSGILGEVFGVAPVIAAFGLLTLAAGLAGLLVPAVRDA